LVAGYWRLNRPDPVGALIARAKERGFPTARRDIERLYPYKPQAYTNFLALAAIYADLDGKTNPVVPLVLWLSNETNQPGSKVPPIPPEVARWADDNAAVAELLLRKLNENLDFDFGCQLTTNGGYPPPLFSGPKWAVTLLLTRSTRAFQSADPESGVAELLGAVKLIRHSRYGGLKHDLAETVVRCGNSRLTYAPVSAMLLGRPVAESQLADLQKEFSQVSELPGLSSALRFEWAGLMDRRQQIGRSGPAAASANELLGILNVAVNSVTGSAAADFADLARFCDARCDAGTGSLTNRQLRTKVIDAEYALLVKKWNRPITRVGFSGVNYNSLSHRDLLTTGWLRCVITALALERFHLRHGRWPETLNALVPKFLPTAPLDPVDEQPLRYRVEPGGYVVYSLGLNGQDDGGLVKTVDSEQPAQELEGDVGIRVNRPQR